MKISVRQICFILMTYTAASKLLMYPTILSNGAKQDLLFAALINFIVCGALVWSVSFLSSKTDKTFFQLLEGTLGNVGARIVYGLFAVFFLLSCILPLFEQMNYVHNIFYDTIPMLIVFLPFFIFSLYAAGKKLQNIGRCADICMPIFAAVMLFMFIMAFSEIQWDNLLPILATPPAKLFSDAAGTDYYFVEPMWMLIFLGHYKYKKGDAAKITLSYAAGAAVVLLFLATFYGVYGSIAPSRTYAIARTSLFFPAIDTIGRVDLILLFALEIVMLFALVINIQLAVHCIAECSGYKNYIVLSLAVNAVLIAIVVFCQHNYSGIYSLYYKWMWIAFLVFIILSPTLVWLLRRKKNVKKA